MRVTMFFLLAGVCIVAPHITWEEAKFWTLICIALAVGFGVIEAML